MNSHCIPLNCFSTIKPPKKDRHAEITSDSVLDAQHHHVHNSAREQSPELARFSALVTRPPKQKTPSTSKCIKIKIIGSEVKFIN